MFFICTDEKTHTAKQDITKKLTIEHGPDGGVVIKSIASPLGVGALDT